MTDGSAAVARLESPGVQRLLSLSDGVVAIALTLLVLQIQVPEIAGTPADSARVLARHLNSDVPQMISYLVAFYVIAQFWLVHHRVFRLINGHSEGLAWSNFVFLLTITMFPFTSNLLGRYDGNPLAVTIFALNLLLASLSTLGLTAYARRHGLLHAEFASEAWRISRIRSIGIIIVVGASIAVAWVNPEAAKYVWILLVVVPFVAARLGRAKVAGDGPADPPPTVPAVRP
jgi:uncharacterized membrane protein